MTWKWQSHQEFIIFYCILFILWLGSQKSRKSLCQFTSCRRSWKWQSHQKFIIFYCILFILWTKECWLGYFWKGRNNHLVWLPLAEWLANETVCPSIYYILLYSSYSLDWVSVGLVHGEVEMITQSVYLFAEWLGDETLPPRIYYILLYFMYLEKGVLAWIPEK